MTDETENASRSRSMRLANTNLALTNPNTDPNWESKKAKLRARKAEQSARARTVTSQPEIVIRDSAYWAHPPTVRVKLAQEAEEAREKWSWVNKLAANQSASPGQLEAFLRTLGPGVNSILQNPDLSLAQKWDWIKKQGWKD